MKNKAIVIGAALLLTAAIAFSYNRYAGSNCCDPSKAGNCPKTECTKTSCDPESCPESKDCCPFPRSK